MYSLMSKRYPQGYYNMELIVARKNILQLRLHNKSLLPQESLGLKNEDY